MKGEVKVFDEAIDIWRDMADRWREIADRAVRERGVFSVALSGGRTPLGFYCYLGREQGLPWDRTELFDRWGVVMGWSLSSRVGRWVRRVGGESLQRGNPESMRVRDLPVDVSAVDESA